jgi:hypothetical protein
MGRFFRYDLKRIFFSGRTVILCVVVPLVVMLLFATMIAPLLVTRSRVDASCFAIYNEDGTQVSKDFIDYVASSKSFEGIVYLFNVDTLEEGLGLVKTGEASGLLHIPAGLYEAMLNGEDVMLDIYGADTHILECSLVQTAIETALNTAGGAQNGLYALRDDVLQLGASTEGADGLYNSMMDCGINVITNRRAILGEDGFISPVGGYLPTEFYLSAMLTWFLSLAILPLAGFSAGDFSLSVLQRGMKTRAMRLRFLSARLFSGALFLLTVMLMIFPIGIVSSSLDRIFHGNIAGLFLSMGFMALCFSALALGIAAWMPGREAAMWLGFWLVIIFSLVGGTAAPESMLPGWVRDLGLWSPVRSAMRLLSTGIFNFDAAVFQVDMLKTGLWGFIGCALAAAGFMRKAVR